MTEKYIQKYIKVDEIHTVAYREYGNAKGIPVLMLHGGPGGCINTQIIKLIDLNYFHLFTIDQRGCGLSTPKGELRGNTTDHLVDDIEKVRQVEGLGKCIIFGRSWGTVLGLKYALKYPQYCKFLFLRSIFLGRNTDELWTFEQSKIRYPDQWAEFSNGFSSQKPLNEQFYEKIFSKDISTALSYSSRMTHYFDILANNNPQASVFPETDNNLIANRIFLHYSVQHYFLDDLYWEQHLSKLDSNDIKGVIIHGAQDSDCLVDQAYYLHKKWKNSTLIVEPKATHSDYQPEIQKQIKNIFDLLKSNFK